MTQPEKGEYTAPEVAPITQVYGDLSQEVVNITVDRLSLILHKNGEGIGKRRAWITPTSLLLTIVIVFTTSDFKQWVFSADTWAAVFVIAAALCTLWLVQTVKVALKTENIDGLIDRIKRGAA